MPEDKKTFRVQGRVANVPMDKVDGFLEKYPEAEEAQSFMVGDRKATIPLDKVDGFLEKYKDAKPLGMPAPESDNSLGKQNAGGMSDNSVGIKLPSSLTGDQLKRTMSQYGLPLKDGLNFDKIASEVSGKSPQEAISIYKGYVLSPKKTSIGDFRDKLISMGISEEEFTDDQIESIVFSGGSLEEKAREASRVLNENRAKLRAAKKSATSPTEYFSPEEDVATYNPMDTDLTLGSVVSKIDLPSSSKTMHAYESNQILLSKIGDYLIGDPNNVSPPPPGPDREAWLMAKAVYNKETSSDYYSRYNQLTSSKGGLVEEAKSIVSSDVKEAVSLGGWATYYDNKTDRIKQDKVDQAADAFAKENRLQIGGPSWMVFRGELETAAKQQYLKPAIDKAIKPLVKEFEAAAKAEAKKLEPEFNSASKLIAKRDLEIKSIGDQLSQEAKQETLLVQAEFKQTYDGLNAAIKSNNDAYAAKREEFQKAVDANLMSVADANAALEKLGQESEQIQQEITAQWAQTNQDELSKYNSINSRYNARYARQQELIISASKDEINKEFGKYIKDSGASKRVQKEFEAKVGAAVDEVIKKRDKDLIASERAAITAIASVMPIGVPSSIREFIATAIPSTVSSFGNYIEGIGYSMENPTLMKFGGYMAESNKLQPAEETLQGMVDAQNYGKISGNVAGSQFAPFGTGLLVTLISRNPALGMTAATAGAVVNFSSETATIAGNIKKQILEKTGSYSKAMEGYSQAIDSQIALSPTYLVEMLPFVSNFYKVFGRAGTTMAGRAITGGLTELTTEVVLQEYPQTVFEEAIIKGEDWRKAYGDALVNLLSGNQAEIDRFGKVTIASSPMFGMGAMGGIASANRSAQAEAKLKKSILAQISLSEYNDSIREQFVYRMVNEKGADFAISTLTQGFAGGLIDKATYDKLVNSVTKSESYAKTAKANGLSQGQSSLYSAMAFQHDRLLEMARTSEDKTVAATYEARAREIQTDIRNVLSGKTVHAAILKFGDKTSVVVTQDDIINRIANDPNFVDSLVDGGTQISLTSDIENFSDDFVRAINTVEKARQASNTRHQNAGAEAAGVTPNAQVVPGLTEPEIASRIAAGQKVDDMALATEAAPSEVASTVLALENESEENPITEQQAVNASDWLYSRYKQLAQLKKSLQDRLATATDKKQKTLLQKAINDLGDTLSSMGDDIAALSNKAKELSAERIANKGESPKRPYLNQATNPTGSTESNSQILKKAQWDPYNDKNYSNLGLDPNSFMAKALDKAFKLAEKLGISFYVYATESEYTAILPQSAGGFASIEKDLGRDGKSSWGIHVNLEALRVAVETPEVFKNKYAGTALDRWYYKKLSGEQIFSNVLRHELGHGVLIKSFGENAAPLYKAIIKDLSKILPSDIIEAATAWADAYTGDISFEEVITELQALMGTVDVKANPSVAAKILDRINKFIESIGKRLGLSKANIEAIKIKSNLNNYIQLSDFLNNFSGFTRGESFTELNPSFALAIAEKYQAKDDSEIQTRRESRADKKAAISIGISPYAEDRIPRYHEIANQISLAKLNNNADRVKALTEELRQAVDDRLGRAIPNAKWKSTPIEGYWKGGLENSIFIEFDNLSDKTLAALAKLGLEFDQDEVHIRSIVGDSNEDYLSVQEDGSMLTVQAVIEFNSEKELVKIIPDIHSKYGIEGASIIGGKNLLVYLAESASLEESPAQINDFKSKVERIVNENERSIRPFEGVFPTKLIRYSRGGIKGESISYKEAISNANISKEEREQISLSPEKTNSDLWANSILSSGQKMMINLMKPFNPKIGRLRKNEQTGAITREGGDRALIDKLTSVGEMFNAAPLFSKSKIVNEAFDSLSRAIKEQYKKLPIKAVPNSKAVELESGKIVWVEDATEPYKSSKEVFDDIENNNNMVFFATNENTYGEKGLDYTGHPMLEKSGFRSASTPVYKGSVNKDTGKIEVGEATGKFAQYELLNNDVLRVVHDFYAHATTDAQFGPRGEEKAWMAHVATILSENKISSRDKLLAIWALTSETRGQNTSVNFTSEWNDNVTYELDRARKLEAEGKIKEADDIRKEFTGDNGIKFAAQKVALLPEEALFSDQQDGKSNDTLLAVLMRDNPDVVASVREETGGAQRVNLDKTSTRQSNPLLIRDKNITLAAVDLEGLNEGEEGFISDYEQLEKLDEVIRESGINILRNKELKHVALDKKGDPVAGLWVENNGDEFSFDIIVSEKHRRKGIAEALLNQAIAEFEYESSINEEMGEDPLSYKVHAVNPNMENLLLRYGFVAEQELPDGSVIMTHPTGRPENRIPSSETSRQSTVNHTRYKPQQTAMASNEDFRAMQVRIYELAESRFKELGKDEKEDKALAISELMAALVEEDIYIDIPSASELYRDLISERNPIYVKKNGQWRLEYGKRGNSSVRSRVIKGLLNLPASRKINRKIIDNMVKNLGYSVENQREAEEVAEIFVEAIGGIEDLSIDELLSVTSELTGATRTLAMGKIASDAYKLGRQAKDAQVRQKFREISSSFLDKLANQAIEDGRANAALYRLYMNNPEMIFALEHKKINAQSSRAMTDEKAQNSKAKEVRKAQRDVKKAKIKAAKKAAGSPKVKTNTPKPKAPSAPKPPSAPAPSPAPQPQNTPPTTRQRIAKKEKDVVDFIKQKLGIRQARPLPSNIDPDVLDAIIDLAREYISEYGIFDAGELFAKINKRFLKDGLDMMAIDPDYFTYTWMEVEQNALAKRAEVLAERLAAKITQRAKPDTAPKTFDPIAFMIDQLYGKATEGLPKKDVTKITPLEKVAEILRNFRDAKNVWESSKGKTEMMIDNLDPQKYTLEQKKEMKEALQDYFDNDIDPLLIKATPYGNKQTVFQQMIKEGLDEEGFDANEVLLSAWDIQAENKADFIEKLVARIDAAARGRLSQSQIDLLANSFAEEYDAILDTESIKALKRSLPRLKSEDKFEKDLRKETPEADRLFNLIKYGAFEPGKMEVTLPDGSLTDGAKLFAEMFNIPYADQDVIDALEVFAERISKTPPNSIFRSSVYNEMMQFVKMVQAENQFSKFSILTAHFYSFILWSSDTIMKAFNSNALTFPYTTLRTVARNAITGKFYAAGLAAKGFYSTTGYSIKAEIAKKGSMEDSDGVPIRSGETYYTFGGGIISQSNPKYELLLPVIEGGKGTSVNKFSIGATEFFLAMNGKRETNVIETESVSEVLARNGKTKLARMWGKFTRIPGRLLSGVDMLTAAMATDGHTADLMYDLIDYTIKEYNKDNPQQYVRFTQSGKSELVKQILGDSGDSFMGSVIQALNEAYEIEQAKTPSERDAAIRKNKLMIQSRIKEITYQSINDRAGELAAKYDYLSGLDLASLEKVIEDARWQSSKIGLMGTPEGTAGAVAAMQQYIGKFVPMSKFFIATFVNAPTNFLSWAIKTNMVTGGVLLPIRVLSKRRGAIISKEMANQHGIRVEFYGKGNFNAEKQDMIIDYMVFNSLKVGMAMTLGAQVLSILIKGYDDDPEKDGWTKDELARLEAEGIDVIQSIPVSRRVKYFFGDPTSKEDSPNRAERWKELPVFVTGKFYGYEGGNYKKTAAFMNRTGLEPMTIYVYGRKVMKYSDNPILFSLFSDQGALFDELIFKESDQIRAEANGLLWGIKSVALSSLTSLESVKEQSMLKPFNEMYSAAFGQGIYSTDDKNFGERGLYYLERQAGNLLASGLLPAEVRNIFKDVGYLNDWSQEDPRGFVEFMVYKMPIANDIFIENERTDPFGFPVVWKLKRELPLGTNYLVDAFSELKFDKTGAKYIALFEDKGSKIHLDPNFGTYYKADKYGDVKKESFSLEQRKKVRDLYKPIIRSVVEELGADNLASYNIVLFEKMVKFKLDMYGGPSGYKRAILNEVLGEEAASLSFIDETDAVLSSKISSEAINMKIEEQIKALRRTE